MCIILCENLVQVRTLAKGLNLNKVHAVCYIGKGDYVVAELVTISPGVTVIRLKRQ